MRRASPLLPMLLLAAGAGAQEPNAPLPLPRVIYGAPEPNVIYGPSSAEPERAPPAAPPVARPATPPAPAPQGSLTYGWGPAYVPPLGYWAPPPHWDRPPRPIRPRPEVSVPPARGGYYEPPQPPGSYVGRPPSAPPEPRWGFERPRR
ncbi:hypothetical protein GXW74_00050 [Roseomonas eburnea]|uniref:Uncharacterized protein n=1 Tax=Neoroseomonas eburnea TaxID=1346889 RepID=A0A9X9X580_9PROT|nr:hypothetical protein [Neoroseomonas eburnea]MBR0678866.1 hypothetical protein [Neoroseomonas eburnea]